MAPMSDRVFGSGKRQALKFRCRIVQTIDLGRGKLPTGGFVPIRFTGDFGVGEPELSGPFPPIRSRRQAVTAHDQEPILPVEFAEAAPFDDAVTT